MIQTDIVNVLKSNNKILNILLICKLISNEFDLFHVFNDK